MFQPARLNQARQQMALTLSLPAPVGGWNARDSIANMDPIYAYRLDNWFPSTADIFSRLGSIPHATGIVDGASNPTQVNTVAVYRPSAGAQQIFAFADQYVYDATGVGAVGAPVVSGLTNSRWQYLNTQVLGGNFLMAVNGSDPLLLYDGATWQSVTNGSTPYAITGVDTSSLVVPHLHKKRIWFIQSGSMDAWYLPFNSIAGAATKFPLGSVFQKGGSLVSMNTWTLDGGTGLDDYAVFITDQGEVAVYQGTDPATRDNWGLLGVYNIGKPIGRRSMRKYGADVLILTSDGLVPGSQAFASNRTTEKIALTDLIQGAFADAYAHYGNNFGWEITQFPKGNMLIINIPVAPNQQVQYVMNSVTGAWCSFSGWPVNSFEIYNDGLYGGTLGAVNQYWAGPSDQGEYINSDCIPAFSYFGARTQLKQWRLIKPTIQYDTNPYKILIGYCVDYKITEPTSEIVLPTATGGQWDVDSWDQAVFAGLVSVSSNWKTVTGKPGFAGAARLKTINKTAQIHLAAFDYEYAPGGII